MIGNITDFRAHLVDRGNVAPTNAGDADATAALFRGSDFVRLAFDLVADETDERIVHATYIAAGYEFGSNGLLPAPGYWRSEDSGKVLTQVGEIAWTLKDGNSPELNAMTPREVVRAALGEAAKTHTGTKFLERS